MPDSITCKEGFPVIGIGASAGGLAAFEAFFSGIPHKRDMGMSFVLIQHLAPDHKSALSEIIRTFTPMSVYEVQDGMRIERNCVYVIAPNTDMVIKKAHLRLSPPAQPHGKRLPIDLFFTSLAQEKGVQAIGIVLSGTGSDGTLGAQAIKGVGGSILVQTLESAAYDGMPSSIIEHGFYDHVLEPQAMAVELMTLMRRRSTSKFTTQGRILILLMQQSRHDFSQYKSSSISRRIERRTALHHLESPEAYLIYLQEHQEEVKALFYDLLIGVTRFFRDDELFDRFKTIVIPELFQNKKPGSTIRVWSAGCSSGEEAYSIAMLLQEYADTLEKPYSFQVFATDIDDRSIAKARAGVYDETIDKTIPLALLDRYLQFDAEENTYRVRKCIRDKLVFSVQNVIQDPPFSKLDLIVCRNVMIYLKETLQKRLISLFHYALNANGTLFLGSSEGIGVRDQLFDALDKSAKIYRKKTPIYPLQIPLVSPLTLSTSHLWPLMPPSQNHVESDGALHK